MALVFTGQNLLRAFVPVLLASVSGAAMAQGTASPSEESDPAAESDEGNEDIIVTAQRRSTSLQRTPVAVAVVSGETLAKQAITTESDLQFATPGLTVKSSQNGNTINYSLRGQTVDFTSGSDPAVLPYFNEVPVLGLGPTAFYDLQSIQVLKGPQGTLFGRNVTGGAVLFSTAKPTEEFSGYAAARYGRFDDIGFEGAVSGAVIPEILKVRVTGLYRKRDGYQLNLFDGTRLGAIERKAARISVTLAPTENLTNEFVFDYLKDDGTSVNSILYYVTPVAENVPGNPIVPLNLIFPLNAAAAAQAARGPNIVDVDALTEHRLTKYIVSNITSLRIGPDTTIKNIFGYINNSTFDGTDQDATRFPLVGYGTSTTPTSGDTHDDEQFSNELQILGKMADGRVEYVAGLYFARSTEHRISNTYNLIPLGAPPILYGVVNTNRSLAGYAQATFDTGIAGFKVTGGLRYTAAKTKAVHDDNDVYSPLLPSNAPLYASGVFVTPQRTKANKLSWTVGLQNQVTSDLLLYANSRRSFRSGGFNFASPPRPGLSDIGGAEFKPEVATDIELGAKYGGSIGDVPVRANIAIYNSWVNDIQRSFYAVIGGNLAGITVNVPKAQITGFEFDYNIQPAEWLSIGGSLNYTNARFTRNQVVVAGVTGGTVVAAYDTYPDTPKWSGVLFADVTIPVSSNHDIVVHGDVFRQTSTYFSSTGLSLNKGSKIPAYSVANFRLGVEPSDGKGFSLSAVVKNAFNELYYTGGIGFASLFAFNTATAGEPRTFLIEARYRF